MINDLAHEKNWQSQLNDLITDPYELISTLKLSPDDLLNGAILAHKQFKLRVPRQFVAKMQVGNPQDPLLLQVLPHHLELQPHAEFSLDPLGEQHANALPGILHKYKSRVLMTITGACAVHCRYCFRRHFPYQDNLPKQDDWQVIKNYIINHPDINEIIFSGGDPLSVSNEKLAYWLHHFDNLAQIRTIRLHTRVPVVIPQRIDEQLLHIFSKLSKKIILVTHCNHPQEIDNQFTQYMLKLKQHNVFLLNQSVLLKGINDNVRNLSDLSYRLFDAHVLPYYLHTLDKVSGASHFWISDLQAKQIYQALLAELPGYLMPKLVREISGERHKTPLSIY